MSSGLVCLCGISLWATPEWADRADWTRHLRHMKRFETAIRTVSPPRVQESL